jgi:hypothetical protein
MKIHKAGEQTVCRYVGFGQYEYVPAPLCVGAKVVYEGKTFYITRLKSKVTCKHCLRKMGFPNE